MPSEQDLPEGPRRRFVAELHTWYEAARWPTLRELDTAIRADDDKVGMASKETIRRMLRGETVPRQWATVEAVLEVICARAGHDAHRQELPPVPEPFVTMEEMGPSPSERLKTLWKQVHKPPKESQTNPWEQVPDPPF